MVEDTIEGMFVNDTGTSLAEVTEVNESFARLDIRNKGGLASSYAMPIHEYDSRFAQIWKPATLAQAREFFSPDKKYRPPLDVSAWTEPNDGSVEVAR